jgi:hypothetical protein
MRTAKETATHTGLGTILGAEARRPSERARSARAPGQDADAEALLPPVRPAVALQAFGWYAASQRTNPYRPGNSWAVCAQVTQPAARRSGARIQTRLCDASPTLLKRSLQADEEIRPLHHPEYHQYALNIRDFVEISLVQSPDLAGCARVVSDSCEGRRRVAAAIDEAIPTPVRSAALCECFNSRGGTDLVDRLLSAMRHEFGPHMEFGAPNDEGKSG